MKSLCVQYSHILCKVTNILHASGYWHTCLSSELSTLSNQIAPTGMLYKYRPIRN